MEAPEPGAVSGRAACSGSPGSLGLSPLSFLFELCSETTWPGWSGPPPASTLSATSFSLLIRARSVQPVFSSASRKESGWIDTAIWLLLSRRGCRFRAALIRPGRLERSFLPFQSPRYLFCVFERRTLELLARLVRNSLPIQSPR